MSTSNSIYKMLFESAAEGLILTNAKGEIILTNPGADKIFGYKEGELKGILVEELLPQNLRDHHKLYRSGYIEKPRRRNMGMGMTLFGQKKDGSKVPLEISLNHFQRDGELMVMAMVMDISKKFEISQKYEKEQENAKLYLDMAGTVFVFLNNSGTVVFINASGEQLLGLRSHEIFGKKWIKEFVFKEDKKIHDGIISELNSEESGHISSGEYRLELKEHGIRTISWKVSMLKNEDDRESGTYLFSGIDITEKIKAEEKLQAYAVELEEKVTERTKELSDAILEMEKVNTKLEQRNDDLESARIMLQESQEIYKIIARNFPKGVISVFDEELKYIFVEGKELFELGVTSEMLIGTKLTDRLSEDIRKQTEDKLKEVFEGVARKIEFKAKDNYYVLNAVPLRSEDGKVTRIMVVEQNVTESKLAEENIKSALKKEKDLGELKSRFVSMASHEFRTPLSTILSSSSLAEKYYEKQDGEKLKKHINRIKSSVGNLSNILNDFLSLDKLEEGKVTANLEKIQLDDFFNDLCEEMEMQLKNGQKLERDIYQDECIFTTDKNILKIIMNNLLSNAIKYSPEYTTIRFRCRSKEGEMKIEVKDEGIGIPEKEQQFLFDRFFRANNASNYQGTGLGLNIVKKYVELLGGEISFESKENKGSTFILEFKEPELKQIP